MHTIVTKTNDDGVIEHPTDGACNELGQIPDKSVPIESRVQVYGGRERK